VANKKRGDMKSTLPNHWEFKHGAYWYRVPARHREAMGGKRWYRLGKSLPDAYRGFAELPIHDDNESVRMVRQLADRYEREYVPQKAPMTQTSYRRSLNAIRDVFGHIPITRLEPAHCYEFYNAKNRTTGAKHVIQVLRHMFTKAIEWGYINVHPIKGNVVLSHNKPRDRYVSDDELIAFRELASPKIQAYIDLKLATGLSKEDLLCIDRADIKDDGLHARRRKTGAKPKVYKWDDEGILQSLLDAVYAAHKGHVGSSRLFHTRQGKPYYKVNEDGHALGQPEGFNSMWHRLMKKWVAQDGERFHEHDIRAKSASDTTIEHAQQLMDHTSANTTERIYRRAPNVVSILSQKQLPDDGK
jgi:integrase